MKDRSIIIIGGGIAGLSAGCYGRMNGYSTTIFEMHKKPGGLCTSWKRQGYLINGCIHWIVGTAPGTELRAMWDELGAFAGKEILDRDVYLQVEGDKGRTFTFYTDIDRLARHMREFAPEDLPNINLFIKTCREVLPFDMPADKAPELYTVIDRIKFMIKYRHLMRTLGM